ncbi:hypothetical protein QIS74_13685 [Colletotrichum tabaci]|uniref:DUF6603 domain-containing protein n=1 Tax=Colletotrichum tabaci TaxID=1209068 RepID=A0AAV9SST1_9PEZI
MDEFMWKFLTQQLELTSISPGSSKQFETAEDSVGGLMWLREGLQATAVEVSIKWDSKAASPRDTDVFVVQTLHLKLCTSLDVLKRQFGDSSLDNRGYHSDFKFLIAISFRFEGVSQWGLDVFRDIPLESDLLSPSPALLFDKEANVDDFPKVIPLNLRNASVKVSLEDWKKLVIRGRLQCLAPGVESAVITPFWLDELRLFYMRDFSTKSTEFEIRGNINLRATDYVFSIQRSAIVRVYIGYNEGWTLSADAVDVQIANFYSLLPIDGSNHALMKLMSDVWVPEISVMVKFANGQAKAINTDGIFAIGPLQMCLTYHHSSEEGWHFTGDFLKASPHRADATLGELLDDFIHDQLDLLPDFVCHLKIPLKDIKASLTCSSKKLAGSKSKDVVFSFTVTVEKFSFTFAQIQSPDGAFPVQSEQDKIKTKRLLRFSLAGLPEAKDIPVIQSLPQPFDEMDFLWASQDVTMAEAKLLNQEVFIGQSPLLHWKTEPVAEVSGGAAMTPVTRSLKGLNIRHMGLKMKNKNTLTITIDAVVSVGLVSVNLIGFEVDINFAEFKTPSDVAKLGIGFSFHGMALAFSRPPATLAGLFEREINGSISTYAGGLLVGVGEWQILAAGVYEEHDDFKTIFVLPAISEVNKFPFVSLNSGAEAPAADVIQQFAALTSAKGDNAWIKPHKDSIWLAAGLSIKAFQMLDVQAAVCIDLSPNPKIGIFAKAVASLPKGSSMDDSLLYLDVGMSALFDPSTGIISIRGDLTPQSFVLSRSCRLNGDFALVYFLPASGHNGDWVFTVGGYHPAFRVPSHYPQDAIMGGGRLDLLYQSGDTRASFSAYANFLLFYDPFQFQATVGVNVFASTRIGWGWFGKQISAELSADVDLHGPPVAGTAHLHFLFFTISVRFGPDYNDCAPLDWNQFYTLVKQSQSYGEARDQPEHLVSLLQGRCTTDSKEKPAPTEVWLIRAAAFEFEVMVRFPLREVRYNGRAVDEGVKARARDIYSMPMKRDSSF